MMKISLLSIISLFFLFACSNRNIDFVDKLGYDYYPLEVGDYIDYQVERVKYSSSGTETTHYWLRELVQDTFKDSDGDLAYRIEVYKRNTSIDDWVLDSVWTSKRTELQASKVQGNHTFVKLSFPVEEGKTWNGNALNGFQEDKYLMQNLGQSKVINGQRFSETLEVIQENDSSLLGKNEKIEYYAKGVGLTYKYDEELVYCLDSPDCYGTISSSKRYSQIIIGYGHQE